MMAPFLTRETLSVRSLICAEILEVLQALLDIWPIHTLIGEIFVVKTFRAPRRPQKLSVRNIFNTRTTYTVTESELNYLSVWKIFYTDLLRTINS